MAKQQQSKSSATLAKLRALAEENLKVNQSSTPDYSTPPEEKLRINHELAVHQIELEMQHDELLQSRAELEKSVGRYAEFYDFAPLGYLSLGRDSRILDANLTASTMLGVARSLLKGVHFKAYVVPEDYAVMDVLLEQVFTKREPGCIEVRLLAGKTETSQTESALSFRTLRIDAAMHNDDYGCRVILSDISEQKQTEYEFHRMTRALRAINECNQSLLHINDEKELLEKICGIMVDIGDYKMAWVGYIEHDTNKFIRPVAQAGLEEGYLKTMQLTWADVGRGRGPAGKSIRTGQPAVNANMLTDPDFEPWRKEAVARSYASVLSLPLKAENEVFGCLCIYSSIPDAFDTDETRLLSALADNLAYGVFMLRTRKAHEEAEEKLRESESRYRSLFQNNHTVMLIIDQQDGAIVDANPAATRYYGWTHEELCRMNIKQINQLTDKEIQAEMQWANTEKRNYFLFRHRLADGSLRDVEVYSGPITIERKSLLYSLIYDITDRKLAESQLLENQKRFTQALEATHAGVWEWSLETNNLIWSEEIWSQHGLERSKEKPTFELWESIVHPDDRDMAIEAVTTAAAKHTELTIEYRVFYTDGSVHWLMSRGKPLYDEQGNAERYIGTVINITNQKQTEEKLIDYKKSFDLALLGSKTGFWVRELKTNELFWSVTLWALYGLQQGNDKPSFKLWQRVIHPEDYENIIRAADAAIKKGIDLNLEYRICHPDGSVHWIMSRGMPLRNKEGSITHYIGTNIDITERKRIEIMLFENQMRFTQALEAAQAGVWEWDVISGENIWSDEIWNLYGLERGKEKPSHELWIRSIHPDDRKKIVRTVLHAAKNANPVAIEYRVFHRDGTMHWLMARGMPYIDEKGSLVRYFGTVINITSRKSLEEQLIESQARFSFMLEKSKMGGWDLDLRDQIAHRTLLHDRIFGYESLLPEWTYKMFLDHVLPEDRAEVDGKFQKAIEDRSEWNFECRICRADGETRWIWAVGGLQHDPTGNAKRMSGIVTDITERKLLEEERESLQAQLHHAQKMQMVGQLAGGIAHDFNNMLTVILGHTELALERSDSSYEDLKAIQKAATHSVELTGQLLSFARRQTVSARIFDLNSSVKEVLTILRRLIGENITLTWTPKVKDATVKLDPSQITQILTNLCVNARDAISGNGTITIETNKIHIDQAKINAGHTCTIPGDYIMLIITDNGLGIHKKHLPHIIEPFFTTKEVGKGSGMGLATVYGIVKQGNGFIDIESEEGKGTRIIIYLPLQREEQMLPVEGVIEEPGLPQSKGLILLVEDQPDILQLCRKMLEHKGYTVLAASNPLEAIEHAERYREQIDLLVSDVIMPEMNGSDLFQKIEPICPKLHVLYMSGYTAEYIAKHLADDKGVNFIEKPFSLTAFTKIVQDIMKKPPEE